MPRRATFSCVSPGAIDAEGHLADVAAVHLLADLPVRLHVARELAALRARVVAQLALVRRRGSVGAPSGCGALNTLPQYRTVAAPPSLSSGRLGPGPPRVRRAASLAVPLRLGQPAVQQVPGRRGEAVRAAASRTSARTTWRRGRLARRP